MITARPFALKVSVRAGVLVLILLSSAGCTFSPEQALVRQVQELSQGWEDQTIQVLQTQPWGDDVIGLVAFQAVRKTGQRQDCLLDYQLTRRGMQWVAGRGGSGCGPADGDGRAIRIGSGQHRGSQGGAWSGASGTLYEPTVASVRVIRDDGQQHAATLVQGHFMVVRSGAHSYSRVEALDDDEKVILSHEYGWPVPGKEDR